MYSGAGQASTSLLTGDTDFIIVDAAPLSAVAGNPKIRFLAVTGEQRLPAYPMVPTTREASLTAYQEQPLRRLCAGQHARRHRRYAA